MDLQKLRYSTEVVERSSLGKAAEALGVSQPAITKSLRLLEAELDVKLLHRTSTGVRPTEYGQSLYTHARIVLAEVRHARDAIDELKGREIRYVRIGSLPSLSELVARACALTIANTPTLQLRVLEMQNYQLLPALRRGDVDFAVGLTDATEPESGIRSRLLGHDRLRFTVRKGHKIARAARPELKHLVGYPWVFPIVGTAHFTISIQRMFEEAGLPAPQASIETGSMQFVKSFVRHTDAVAILSEHVTEAERDAGLLVSLPIESPALTRPIGLFDLASAPRPRVLRELTSNLERVFRDWENAHPVTPPR